MIDDVLLVLWLSLPAVFANIIPIPIATVPWLQKYNMPMDFGKTWRGKRIFGANKTWRGFIAAVVAATLVVWLQQLATQHYIWAADLTGHINFAQLPTLALGFLYAVGVIGGDAIESFFKRQRGIPPGRSWFPWDQVDSVIGTAVAVSPLVILSAGQYVLLIIMLPIVHLVSTFTGYHIGLKDSPV